MGRWERTFDQAKAREAPERAKAQPEAWKSAEPSAPAARPRMPWEAPKIGIPTPKVGATFAPSAMQRTAEHLQMRAKDPTAGMSGGLLHAGWSAPGDKAGATTEAEETSRDEATHEAEGATPQAAGAAPAKQGKTREKEPAPAPPPGETREKAPLQMACGASCTCPKCSAGKSKDVLGTLGIQREARPGAGPPQVDGGAIRARLSAGTALPETVADRFSNAYGHDLSSVRVHANHTLPGQVGARAFTVGRDVAFAPGEYNPGTPAGDRLIGHELAHVVQQSSGANAIQGAGLSEDHYEREADAAAEKALSGGVIAKFSAVGQALQKAPPLVLQDDNQIYIEFEFRGQVAAVFVTLPEEVEDAFDNDASLIDILGANVTDALSPGGVPLPETVTYVGSTAVSRLIEKDLPTWLNGGGLPTLVSTLTARAEVLRKQQVRAGLEEHLGVTGTIDWPSELPAVRASIETIGLDNQGMQSDQEKAFLFLDMLEAEVATADKVVGGVSPPYLALGVYSYAVDVYQFSDEARKLFSEKFLLPYLNAIAALQFVPEGFDILDYKPFDSMYSESRRDELIDDFVDAEAPDLIEKYVLDRWTESGVSPENFLDQMDLEAMRTDIIDHVAEVGLKKALTDKNFGEALRDKAADKTRYGILRTIAENGQKQEAFNKTLPGLASSGFAEIGSIEEEIFDDPWTYYDSNFAIAQATHAILSSVEQGAKVEQSLVAGAAMLAEQGRVPKTLTVGLAIGVLVTAFRTLRREVDAHLEKAKQRIAERLDLSFDKLAKIVRERIKSADAFIREKWIPELKKVASARIKANYDELKKWLDHFEPETAAVVGRYQITAVLLGEVAAKLESGETTSVSYEGSVITKSDLPELKTAIALANAKATELSTKKGKDKKKEDLQKAIDAFDDVQAGIKSGKYKPVDFGPSVGDEAKKNLGIGGFDPMTPKGLVLSRRATARANPFQAWAIERWVWSEREAEQSKNMLFMGAMALLTVASFLVPGVGGAVLMAIDIGVATYSAAKNVGKAKAALDLARLDIDQSIGGITVEQAKKALRNAWINLVVSAVLAGIFGALGGRMVYKGIQARRLPHLTKLMEADAALAGKILTKVKDTKVANSLLGKFKDPQLLAEALAYAKDGKSLLTLVDKVKDAELAHRLLVAAGKETELASLLSRWKSPVELEVLLGKATPKELAGLYDALRAAGAGGLKAEAGVARLLENMSATQANRLLSAGLDVETAVVARNLTGGTPEAMAELARLAKSEPVATKALIKGWGNEALPHLANLPGANVQAVEKAILEGRREAMSPALREATQQYGTQLIEKGMQEGVVGAGVVDLRTGQRFFGHNPLDKKTLPSNLHPILKTRLEALRKLPPDKRHFSVEGSHAEVYALNDALWAREKALGRAVKEADLGEIVLDTVWLKKQGKHMIPGLPAPRCTNCQYLTDGVINLAGDAAPKPPRVP